MLSEEYRMELLNLLRKDVEIKTNINRTLMEILEELKGTKREVFGTVPDVYDAPLTCHACINARMQDDATESGGGTVEETDGPVGTTPKPFGSID